MEVSTWLKHKVHEQEALARAVDEFIARGGVIEVLPQGARSVDQRTVKQVHESNVRAKMAKNKAFAKKPAATVTAEETTEEEAD